ncbi:S-adenosyl-L-methionine-dependent methyltransferase [Ilyonectria robusta]|uniref:S-adenosyl-L-methionine-dependent methyltransferase n=1 Tax=Ilyonectria robusta TaxID=1079257 RepID=UPI001E8DA611|nr:S-adenosyl-L-methionine-dependent methyltransferase [Ilyonectria robusta]KAH8658607.1 S-adenosyl-L-methionine-dependent methyltransferase [Ilyonectria robusta]
MAYATDNGRDSSSMRSGGGSTDQTLSSAVTRPPAQTSMSTLTASSSSNYSSSVSSGSQNQGGGIPGTPMSRRSGGWDRHTLSPAAAARARFDDPMIEDHVVDQPSSLRPQEDLDDSSDSSDEYMTSYKPLERKSTKASGSRSKRFFQSFVKKLTKSSVRPFPPPPVLTSHWHPRINQTIHRLRLGAKQPVIQHTIIIDVFRGRLHLAPISSKPRRVLDVGTGPGTWALPAATRSNCSFMTVDITHDWDFTDGGNFDFIHIRQLGDIQDKKKLLQSAFDNLKPGGWVELTEWIAILQSPNHSLDGTAFRRWNDLLEQGMRTFGTTLYYPNHFKPLLQETGFDHIIETRNGATSNACYPGKKLQRIGHLMTQNWLMILEPLTMPVFTQALGWTPDEVKSFLVDVRKEIPNTKYHSFMTLITFCAQKPLNSSSTSAKSTSASASASESSLPTIK